MFLLCIIGNVAAQRVEIERKWAEIKATPKDNSYVTFEAYDVEWPMIHIGT